MVALSTAGPDHALCGASKRYPDACAHQLFEQQVDRTPDAVAVIHEGRRLTYRELDERANQLARFLCKQGVNAEGLVGVCMQRVPELAVALLGVWKAGAAYVPIDPTYPRDRVSFMIGDAGVRVLLTDRSCEDRFAGAAVETVCLDGSHATRVASEDRGRPAVSIGPSSLAYVMYTSGSTGQPKGAMIVHSGLVNYLCWAIEAYGVEAGGSVPVHSSIAFDLTVTSLYPALLAGAQIELLPEDVGAQNLLAALRRTRGRNLVKITPAHLDVLTRLLRPEELSGMTKLFVIGGENLPAESLSAWRDLAPGTRFVNEYGPTETVVGCCIHEVRESDPRNGSVPIGLPIANTQLYLLDADLRPVAAGATGELYIGGAGVARGYLNRPELTRERFLPDPFAAGGSARMYKTGDLARRRPDGLLEFLGRIDNQVKVRGYRIELGEIEAALASHPDVQSCAVLAREDSPGNKQLVGYLVPHEGRTVATQQVQEFLGGRLPEYMVPPRLVALASMPLTVNGKVDRNALPAPSDAESAGKPAARAPRDETQRGAAEIWRELLEVEEIGLDSDFFELGGHSLAAVKALATVRDRLGVDLELQVIFEHSTLEAFAAQVAAARGTAPEAPRIPPRGVDGPCPVSPAQEQMWLLHQLAPESPAYNIPDVIPLPGKYDAQALQRAVSELVARHEALRTTFSRESGDLVQIAHAPFRPEVRDVDLRPLAEAERQGAWDRVVREQARAKFDLARLPLLRATVVHRSEGDHQLLFTVHHIVSDEWSMELVHREIAELYQAFSQGRPPKLEPLPIQYADYAVWQRAQLQGDELRKQLDYWTQDLEGAPTGLALPLDRPHPETPSDRGSTERFELSSDLSERLQALCREEQATLFMALEAAFAALLHRISGQEDILVGTPISNRTQAETQGLIGCFLNTVVLRTRFQHDSTYRSLLRQVRSSALGAYAHAELPFERLVAALSPAREPGRTPLFQVMFVLHDRDGVVSKVWSDRALQTDTSKFDLTLFVTQSGKGLAGVVEYSTDVFERETVRRICRSYARLLDSLVRGPDREIAGLPMLAETDRQQLLSEWNDTAVVFDDGAASLHALLSRQAARTPDRAAVTCQGRTVTYGELDRSSDRLARHLVSLGVGPDVLVGLVFERSVDMMVGLLGVLKAGGAYVPLDPSFPAERLAHMIEDSRMPVLVTHGAARGVVESLPSRPRDVVWLDRDPPDPASNAERAMSARVAPENLAYVLYTSGSTGKPKGVAIPHSAIVNFLLSMKREPGIAESDTLLAVTTLSFDIAALELFLPLVMGAKVVIARREDVLDPHFLMRLMKDSGCTVMQATPSTWRALVDAGWAGSPRLKILCGGEAMPADLSRALLPRCAELWNMYGPTETTVWSTLHRVRGADGQPPIGHPLANTQVYVLDAKLDLVPPGAAGELYIGGDGLARGYLHRPELTQERFVASPFQRGARLYRTGDLARWRADGALECLGRTDHQVKLRGYRIELGEIEASIARHPGVRQVVVVAREDVPGDKRLVAYVVARETSTDPTSELRELVRKALPDYMVPAHFVTLGSLPLTPNGKIDRKALPRPAADALLPSRAYVAPSTELEASLAAAWQRVLGVPRVSVQDNFFELGGDSLKVLKLIVQMERTSGIEIDLGAVFRFPTIAALAKSIGSRAAKEAAMAVPLQADGEGRPVFCLCGINMYQELATSLGPRQPVYGVYVPEEQVLARGALEGAKLDIDIARLARSYYQAIQRVSPKGPYRLAGSSFGGIVALEVASMMRQDGAEVELVALLDTLSPRGIRRNWVKWFYRRAGQVVSGEAGHKLLRQLSKLHDKLVARGWLRGERDPEKIAEEAYALKQQAYFAAIAAWQSRKFVTDYDVVLFRAAEQAWGPQDELDDDYGWHHYLNHPLTVVDVPGTHLGMLKNPHVAELGQRVREHLPAS